MDFLVKNDKYALFYNDRESGKPKYVAYFTTNPIFMQEVEHGEKLTSKFSKYFNDNELRKAKSLLHTIRYINKTFKS